jgi:hypothetical protein
LLSYSTFLLHIETLLAKHPVATAAELQTLATFINDAKALVALPQYQAMQHEDATERHCVRCHATFTNGNNGPKACTIPHVFDTEPSFTGEVREDKVYSYRSACCGSGVELEEQGAGNLDYLNTDKLGWCSEDHHTTDVDEVEDEEEYNGVNIHRCKIDKESGECGQDMDCRGKPRLGQADSLKVLSLYLIRSSNASMRASKFSLQGRYLSVLPIDRFFRTVQLR